MNKISGVYEILNLKNNKRYIGSSCNIYSRLYYHFKYLKNNSHTNKYLQRSWNKYGEVNFKVNILEYVEDEILLRETEQKYINLYDSKNLLLNVSKNVKSFWKGQKHTKESKEKMSKMQKGRPSNKKGKTYEEMYGKEKAENYKKKLALTSTGRENKLKNLTLEEIHGEEKAREIRKKISKANKNKKKTKEHRRKIGEGNKGKDHRGKNNPMYGKGHKGKKNGRYIHLSNKTIKKIYKEFFINKKSKAEISRIVGLTQGKIDRTIKEILENL